MAIRWSLESHNTSGSASHPIAKVLPASRHWQNSIGTSCEYFSRETLAGFWCCLQIEKPGEKMKIKHTTRRATFDSFWSRNCNYTNILYNIYIYTYTLFYYVLLLDSKSTAASATSSFCTASDTAWQQWPVNLSLLRSGRGGKLGRFDRCLRYCPCWNTAGNETAAPPHSFQSRPVEL